MKKRRRTGYAAGGTVAGGGGVTTSPAAGTAQSAGTADASASTGKMPSFPIPNAVLMSMSLDARANNPADWNEDATARASRPAQAPVVPPQMRFAKGGEVESPMRKRKKLRLKKRTKLPTGYQEGGEVEDDDEDSYTTAPDNQEEVDTQDDLEDEERRVREQREEDELEREVSTARQQEEKEQEEQEPGQRGQPREALEPEERAERAEEQAAPSEGGPEEGGGGRGGGGSGGGGGGPQEQAQRRPEEPSTGGGFEPYQVAGDMQPPPRSSRLDENGNKLQTGYGADRAPTDAAGQQLQNVLDYTRKVFGLEGNPQQPQQVAAAPEQPPPTGYTGARPTPEQPPAQQQPMTPPPVATAAPAAAPLQGQQAATAPQPGRAPTAGPPPAPAGTQGGLQAYMSGQRNFTQEQMTDLIDRATAGQPNLGHSHGIQKTFQSLVDNGDMDGASRFVQSLRPSYDRIRGALMAAAGNGDFQQAMQLAETMNNLIPNGRTVDFRHSADGNITVSVHPDSGRGVASYSLTPQQFVQYATGPTSVFDIAASKGIENNLAGLSGGGADMRVADASGRTIPAALAGGAERPVQQASLRVADNAALSAKAQEILDAQTKATTGTTKPATAPQPAARPAGQPTPAPNWQSTDYSTDAQGNRLYKGQRIGTQTAAAPAPAAASAATAPSAEAQRFIQPRPEDTAGRPSDRRPIPPTQTIAPSGPLIDTPTTGGPFGVGTPKGPLGPLVEKIFGGGSAAAAPTPTAVAPSAPTPLPRAQEPNREQRPWERSTTRTPAEQRTAAEATRQTLAPPRPPPRTGYATNGAGPGGPQPQTGYRPNGGGMPGGGMLGAPGMPQGRYTQNGNWVGAQMPGMPPHPDSYGARMRRYNEAMSVSSDPKIQSSYARQLHAADIRNYQTAMNNQFRTSPQQRDYLDRSRDERRLERDQINAHERRITNALSAADRNDWIDMRIRMRDWAKQQGEGSSAKEPFPMTERDKDLFRRNDQIRDLFDIVTRRGRAPERPAQSAAPAQGARPDLSTYTGDKPPWPAESGTVWERHEKTGKWRQIQLND